MLQFCHDSRVTKRPLEPQPKTSSPNFAFAELCRVNRAWVWPHFLSKNCIMHLCSSLYWSFALYIESGLPHKCLEESQGLAQTGSTSGLFFKNALVAHSNQGSTILFRTRSEGIRAMFTLLHHKCWKVSIFINGADSRAVYSRCFLTRCFSYKTLKFIIYLRRTGYVFGDSGILHLYGFAVCINLFFCRWLYLKHLMFRSCINGKKGSHCGCKWRQGTDYMYGSMSAF